MALAVVVGVQLGACDDDDPDAAGVLAERIDEEAPAGFRPAAEGDGLPLGAFDLDGFLEIYSTDPAEDESLLREHGFEAGYTRTWIDEDTGTVATVIGFQFEEAAGAGRVREALDSEALTAVGATGFEVPGLPEATGIRGTQPGEDGAQYIQTVSVAVGPRLFTAAVVTPRPSDDTELVTSLARRQAADGRSLR